MDTILVTGATGNVGREVVRGLLARGARVRVGEISRLRTGATRSGLIGNSRSSSPGSGVMLWPACSSSSFSGSMVMELVSTEAEAEIAPAMGRKQDAVEALRQFKAAWPAAELPRPLQARLAKLEGLESGL